MQTLAHPNFIKPFLPSVDLSCLVENTAELHDCEIFFGKCKDLELKYGNIVV